MEQVEKDSQMSELDSSAKKVRAVDDFEVSLKKCLSATHKDGEEVEGAKMPDLEGRSTILSPQQNWCFDAAWRIDDVNQSNQKRTQSLSDQFGKQYVVICARQINDDNTKLDMFEFPPGSALRLGIERIRYKGLRVTTGKWLVAGQPLAIVMDLDSVWWAFDRYRVDLFNNHIIKVAADDEPAREMILFGFMVAQFMADFNYELTISGNVQYRQSKIRASFHEWITGVGLVLLRDWLVPSSTTFFVHESNSNPDILNKVINRPKK